MSSAVRNIDGCTNNLNFKVVLLGEGCVGKTSLVLRYVENKFNSEHISTIQASFLNKKVNIDGRRINLAIWDTAGQEKFHALGPIYYRCSNGAVLVYDITDEDSFQKVKNWVKELRKILGNNICLVIAGNKTDLEVDRKVPIKDAESYADKVGAVHYQTSAKLNQGVEDMFFGLTQQMLLLNIEKESKSTLNNDDNCIQKSGNVIIVDDDVENKSPSVISRSCCSGSS